MTAVLAAVDVGMRYGGIVALDRVSVEVGPAEIVGVVGANGAGKTTVLDVLSGAQRPDAGTVMFLGRDVTGAGADARARLGIIRSFQDAWLFPLMTVRDVLLLAQERRLPSGIAGSVLALPRWRDGERRRLGLADAAALSTGLGAHLDKRVGELSTGLRRALDLACTLSLEPVVLLLDEPSAGLASAEVPGLGEAVRRARDETGASVVLVEHDLPLVWSLADRVVVMADGRVTDEGRPEQLRHHPAVRFGE